MIQIRPSHTRGSAEFGWLHSQHSFSFGNYYDPQQMGYSALRVINDDHVSPEAGFETHGHRDMEIISYVLEGEIAHKDSEGNVTRLPPGEFQLMSAGRGIRHSEFNPSVNQPLHFLQIWIQPNVYGQAPGYQQKNFGREPGLTLIASPGGENGSLDLKQDARLYQVILPPNTKLQVPVAPNRRFYIHQVSGELELLGHTLQDGVTKALPSDILHPGDGAKIEQLHQLLLVSGEQAVVALLFDLP